MWEFIIFNLIFKTMIILSLFDGISCWRVALERAGIPIKKYFAIFISLFFIFMKFNKNTIERVWIFPETQCPLWEFRYIPEKKGLFNYVIPEHIKDGMDYRKFSLAEFKEEYWNKYFLKNKIPHRKASVIIYFVSWHYKEKYFDSMKEANDYYSTFNQDYFVNL